MEGVEEMGKQEDGRNRKGKRVIGGKEGRGMQEHERKRKTETIELRITLVGPMENRVYIEQKNGKYVNI